MADKYTYADVIIDPNDPRVEIGAEYYAANSISSTLRAANQGNESLLAELDSVNREPTRTIITSNSFTISYKHGNGGNTDFLIRKKEPVKKYVPFEFDDPEVRRELMGKTIVNNYGLDGDGEFRELMIIGFENKGDEDADDYSSNGYTEGTVVLTVEKWFHADELLKECTFVDGSPCGVPVEEA